MISTQLKIAVVIQLLLLAWILFKTIKKGFISSILPNVLLLFLQHLFPFVLIFLLKNLYFLKVLLSFYKIHKILNVVPHTVLIPIDDKLPTENNMEQQILNRIELVDVLRDLHNLPEQMREVSFSIIISPSFSNHQNVSLIKRIKNYSFLPFNKTSFEVKGHIRNISVVIYSMIWAVIFLGLMIIADRHSSGLLMNL